MTLRNNNLLPDLVIPGSKPWSRRPPPAGRKEQSGQKVQGKHVFKPDPKGTEERTNALCMEDCFHTSQQSLPCRRIHGVSHSYKRSHLLIHAQGQGSGRTSQRNERFSFPTPVSELQAGMTPHSNSQEKVFLFIRVFLQQVPLPTQKNHLINKQSPPHTHSQL